MGFSVSPFEEQLLLGAVKVTDYNVDALTTAPSRRFMELIVVVVGSAIEIKFIYKFFSCFFEHEAV